MNLSNYGFSVWGKSDKEGYVDMSHDEQYRLYLTNSSNLRVDAEVNVDGKLVGVFRIDPFSNILLERPVNETGKFTFYKDGTVEARESGLSSVSKNNRGLLQATFKPEVRKTVYHPVTNYALSENGYSKGLSITDDLAYSPNIKSSVRRGGPGGQSVNSGGTGLSGNSNQKFIGVEDLEYDQNEFVTISLRLVCSEKSSVRPLKSLSKLSNTVPRPV